MSDEKRLDDLWAKLQALPVEPDALRYIDTRENCPRQPHRGPQGPNEDLGQCPLCLSISYSMRPEGETYGLHLEDCSLPVGHESNCQPGGAGHLVGSHVRGWFGPEFEAQHQQETP